MMALLRYLFSAPAPCRIEPVDTEPEHQKIREASHSLANSATKLHAIVRREDRSVRAAEEALRIVRKE